MRKIRIGIKTGILKKRKRSKSKEREKDEEGPTELKNCPNGMLRLSIGLKIDSK